ncbi:tetratricopeptide repeat protein [Thermomonas carbonis]|uniref:Cytochrome C biogenesis protein n=1 Tax=Thermomonas carbonis TaxID=1463158 RepID=A0A7G9SNA3_9GAMM|nr:tetratricopeptide repeat protein [Thermomonas carbonis]QNN69328.1 cytochrome C biogenesis protein [Thermomonas carbonis]GHC05226.1 cytochrome c biogenesis protein [Thermomonas carbonis]
MTVFVALATLLCLATVAVLLRPLWRDARGVALGIGVIMLASTGLLYMLVGTPRALDGTAQQTPKTLGDAIVQLEAELQRDPRQAEGWRLLGQAYQREGQAAKSRDAYAKAVALLPDNPDLLTEAAQSRALAHPQRLFDAQAVDLLKRAIAAEATHQRARWFLGIAQRQTGDNAAAAATWEPLLAQVDAATATSLRKEIDAARADAGLPALVVALAPAAPETSDALAVKVALDPDFAARVRLRGDATVFVIARAPDGPPMPVAVEKRSVSDLPFTASLDDGDSPMPTLKLSQLKEVVLVARLSQSGIANKQDGDIESKPVRVTLPADEPVKLVIGK